VSPWTGPPHGPRRSAVDPRWIARPTTAATAIGRGLRVLPQAVGRRV